MATFTTFDGLAMAYETEGEGEPVLMLHGFAADARSNWVQPRVSESLVAAGRMVVLPDARGHGASDKPHDPAAYSGDPMVRDAQALLDHLDITEVDVVGYSMGAYATLRLAAVDRRVRRMVLGGIGSLQTRNLKNAGAIADALTADDPSSSHPMARTFRAFADSTGADRDALAAVLRGGLPPVPDVAAVTAETLVVVGEKDALAPNPSELVNALPGSRLIMVPGDHLTAVNKAFTDAVVEFLTG